MKLYLDTEDGERQIVAEIMKMSVNPDDIVIIAVPDQWYIEDAIHLQSMLAEIFKDKHGADIIVLHGDVKITKVTPAEQTATDDVGDGS